MDRSGVERCVTLEWHDGFGDTLREHLEIFNRFPGRFTVFGNVDFSRINEPDFATRAAEQMRRDADAGMAGLKVFKALGLDYRHPDGSFWRIDDERLDPIWAEAGRLGLPILMHTADPRPFWQPVTDRNFWDGVLYGEYAWWTYYRKDFPPYDTLLGERNEVIARHPDVTFICPHLGSRSDALDIAADELDLFPNLYYDISARIPILGLSERRARHGREFLEAYRDRILFGTDIIYDDTHVPTGTQAQGLFQPGEIPIGNADPNDRYIESTIAFLQSHLDFLTTDRIQENPPFKRNKAGFRIRGLNLSEPTRDAILHGNARRLIPALH
jgi:predicted TIM-barrel fold metal-dependent hydrolase